MKIITEPKVHLLSFPMFEPHPTYELPFHGVPAENIIATAGKVCYNSYGLDGKPVPGHIKTLVDSGHHSVLEHVHVGLFIEGISRGCSHEVVRHRMFNYSQRSTRYTAEDDAAIVLDPYYADIYRSVENGHVFEFEDDRDVLLRGFLQSAEASIDAYKFQVAHLDLLSPPELGERDRRKWCRGKARQLLPHALETRMVMTGNLRAWRHFLLMRTSRHAEAEIRRLADMVYRVVARVAPTVFQDLSGESVDGYIELMEDVG